VAQEPPSAPPAHGTVVDPVELARVNADLEAFGHAVAHDLREPLRSIRLITEFMREDAPNMEPALAARVGRLGELASRAEQMVGALLEHARAGLTDPRCEDVPLAELAREAVDTVPGGAEAVRIAPDLPTVHADRALIRRVLIALVSNGLRFNRSSRKIVEVGALSGPDRVTVSVRDNGIGIDSRRADVVFRMFGRLHPRDEFGGIGAGLAIARRIVERHAGGIWFEPRAEGGTAFFFTLPRARGGDAPAPRAR
jgi:light-regulated signal transduction histidine kinase (bacteriophytochrome)